jgi:hypothetical protein
MSDWYLNPVGGYTTVSVVMAVLVAILFLIGISRSHTTPGRRATLLALRVAILALFAFALLRPSLVLTTTKKQSATLVVLADRSRSMMVADSFNNKSRWDALKATLTDALPGFAELAEENEVKLALYTFDAEVQSHEFDPKQSDAKIDLGAKAEGTQTAIGAALEEVLRRESGKRLAGVLLLSDGAQRAYAPRDLPPQTPARRLADLGYPLYTFAFGQSRALGQARDVALVDLVANQTVFVKNELVVLGSVRIDGYPGLNVPVQLLWENPQHKMNEVAVESVSVKRSGEALPVELSYVPEVPGEYKVTLRAAKQAGELVTTNNELSTFVTVKSGGLNVLYLEGALRVEQKFIRRALDASPDIKVDYVRLESRSPTDRASLMDRFQRGKYDVYLLGDVDAAQFSKDELQALATTVREGAGLLMLGGFHTFGPGGYAETPLANLLPVRMDALERQRFDEAIRPDVHLSGKLQMRPAKPLGMRHFVMSLARGPENLAAWQALPPLEGANRFGPLKPNAQVLAETSDGKPLLVAAEAGGRVMAFAGDSTWHWWLNGHEAALKRFWRQLILWLAHKDDVAEGNVWIQLAQRRFAPGARVDFNVGAQSAQGDLERSAIFEAEVVSPSGTRQPVRLTSLGEQTGGSFLETREPGDYTIEVSAMKDGAKLGTARARFLVFEQDLELDNAAADPTLMASLAKITATAGGKSLAPEELPVLINTIMQRPIELEMETQVKQTPWDTWPFFLLFVGLMSVEWFLRKKWGLV